MEIFLEWVVESSLLVLMIIGIRKLFMGKIRYALIYALWGVVLLRFLIPVNFFNTPLSAAKFVSDAFTSRQMSEKKDDDVETSQNTEGHILQSEKADINVSDEEVLEEKEFKTERLDDLQSKNIHMPIQTEMVSQTENESLKKSDGGHFWKLLCKVWAVGSVVILLWFFLSNYFLLRKIKHNRVLYGVRDNIDIYSVYDVKNPCLYGFLKPSIYLPVSLVSSDTGDRLDDDVLEQIITHEIVHYRHGDHLWAVLRMLMVSVYWFDPFVWMASVYSKKDAELFCDETVLRILGEDKRFCYGEMLVNLAGDSSWGDFRYSIMPMSRRGKDMEKRIRAISEKKRYSKWLFIPLTIILSVTLAITFNAGVSPFAKENDSQQKEADKVSVNNNNANVSDEKAKEKQEAESEYSIEEQLLKYSDFLKANAGKEDFKYYSLGWLLDAHVVLMVSPYAMLDTETKYGSSLCRIYNIVDGKVAYCGEMACSSSGDYVHIADGKIMTDTHHSVTSAKVEVNSNKLIEETIEEPMDSNGYTGDDAFFEEFAKAATVVFYTNPYIGKKIGSDEPKAMSLQNVSLINSECYIVYDHGYDFIFEETDKGFTQTEDVKETYAVYAQTPEAAFELYIKSFTDAVNTGDIGKLSQVLSADSDVYEQQCDIVKNYYKRGIRETVKSCSVLTVDKKSEIAVNIISKEKIKVSYADKTSKLVKQSYCYTCEYIDNTWVITKMEDVK